MDALGKSLAVGVGAFVGANGRYWLGAWIAKVTGGLFPWHTLFINASGSLLLGLFMGMATKHAWGAAWKELVAVGLLGGYTTFSTFSLETVVAIHEGRAAAALGYVAGSFLLCIAGAALGLWLANAAG